MAGRRIDSVREDSTRLKWQGEESTQLEKTQLGWMTAEASGTQQWRMKSFGRTLEMVGSGNSVEAVSRIRLEGPISVSALRTQPE